MRSEQQSQRACGPQPEGARSSACLANRNPAMFDRRLSRQNVKLFLREPLVVGFVPMGREVVIARRVVIIERAVNSNVRPGPTRQNAGSRLCVTWPLSRAT